MKNKKISKKNFYIKVTIVISLDIDYLVAVQNVKDETFSLTGIISDNKVKDTRLNCNYIIYPTDNKLVISGKDEKEIQKCANAILRTLSRKQKWRYGYSLRVINVNYGGTGRISRSVRRSVVHVNNNRVQIKDEIKQEYDLPAFFDIIFQEAIFNNSIKKYRVAFILAFSAIEKAVKLINKYHCKRRLKPRKGMKYPTIEDLFYNLRKDIPLQVNVSVFNDGSRFRRIRNDIAHGDSKYPNEDIKSDVGELLQKIDDIFRELSSDLFKYQQHI